MKGRSGLVENFFREIYCTESIYTACTRIHYKID